MDKGKELKIQGYKKFICPNISLIDDICKDYNIREDIIEKTKDIAIEYFKKTYDNPPYSSAVHVLPAAFYIASRLKGEKRSQKDVALKFYTTVVTIKKWYINIMIVLDIKTLEREHSEIEFEKFKNSELFEIHKIGKLLLMRNSTIQKAKDIASKYFEKAKFNRYHRFMNHLRPAFVYTASIIENEGLRQLDISQRFGIAECIIGKWHKDIIKVLGMKIIAHHGQTIQVLEEQYDDDYNE